MSAVRTHSVRKAPRTLVCAALAFAALACASAPAQAANFFEKLFGVQRPAAAPRPAVALPPPVLPVQRATQIRREKPKARISRAQSAAAPGRVVGAATPEILPGPLGPFLRDPTLRRGDVVVTSEGLKVFAGQGGAQHRPGDFLALAQAGRFAAGNSSVLAAIDRANRFSTMPLVQTQLVPAPPRTRDAPQRQAAADAPPLR